MNKHVSAAWRAAAAMTCVLAGGLAGVPSAGAATSAEQIGQPTISWQPCPDYSDEVLRWLRYDDEQIPEVRRLLAAWSAASLGCQWTTPARPVGS